MASVTKQRARRSKNVIDWNLNIIIKVTRVILCYWNAFELDIVSGYPSRGGCPTSYTTLPASRCGTALHVRQRGLAPPLGKFGGKTPLRKFGGKLLRHFGPRFPSPTRSRHREATQSVEAGTKLDKNRTLRNKASTSTTIRWVVNLVNLINLERYLHCHRRGRPCASAFRSRDMRQRLPRDRMR